MGGFILSFKPILDRFKSEIILLGCALFLSGVSVFFFLQQKATDKVNPPIVSDAKKQTTHQSTHLITIDVSGAVKNPFVYSLTVNSRLIDALNAAGGITNEADERFVKRNMNYARVINDQEKIYIPFLSDTADGIILENKRVIDYTQPSTITQADEEQARININMASVAELDQLAGVGQITAESIINGRPYTSPDDLIKNSIVKKTVYDKIKDQISVY